jgi:Kef-type K+ transport system membrane component KefB
MNEKLINKLTWLLIFSSLVYLGYVLVIFCLGDIQQYTFLKEHGGFSKNDFMVNFYFASYAGISTLWLLVVLILFLMKKRAFKYNLINLYISFSIFLVFTFLISEYITSEYSFYFHKTSEKRLLLFFSYSVIYSIVALIVGRSKFISRKFTR